MTFVYFFVIWNTINNSIVDNVISKFKVTFFVTVYCLDCYEVDHPDNCTQSTACSDGKVCTHIWNVALYLNVVFFLQCNLTKRCDYIVNVNIYPYVY